MPDILLTSPLSGGPSTYTHARLELQRRKRKENNLENIVSSICDNCINILFMLNTVCH